MKDNSAIRYDAQASAWFRALDELRPVVQGAIGEKYDDPGYSLMVLDMTFKSGGKKTIHIPVQHGLKEATEYSLQYVMELPFMWQRLGCKSMTVLQALEVKSRALIMGDIATHVRTLIDNSLVEKDFEGIVRVRNPYHRMTVRMAELLEKHNSSVVKITNGVPSKWRSVDAEDAYDIRSESMGSMVHCIGLAIYKDAPDVSPFDLTGSIGSKKCG